MAEQGTHDFVVTYRSRPRALVEVWLRITGVPREVPLEAVELALEASPDWARWQARIRPGAVVSVRVARSNDHTRAGVPERTWAEFVPAERTITVRVSGELHAAVSRIARGRGVSLVGLVDGLLRDLAALEGEAVPAAPARRAPAPAFVDVPLPIGGAE
jgi:hypothetical protein